jgi:hypothetical protein
VQNELFVADQHIRVHVQERVPSVVNRSSPSSWGPRSPTCARLHSVVTLLAAPIGVASLIQPSPHLGTGPRPKF